MQREQLQPYVDAFIAELKSKRPFRSDWVEPALCAVPRHLFLEQFYEWTDSGPQLLEFDPRRPDERTLKIVYSDTGLQIRLEPHSAASQPVLVVDMLEKLQVEPGHKVLEIGTGSGWNAGLLAYRAGDEGVYSIDLQADLVEKARTHLTAAGHPGVSLRAGDGGLGWPEAAPFDRIIVTVGCPDIPPAWTEQLAEGGALLLPLKTSGLGDPLLRLEKHEGRLAGRFVGWSGFKTLQGAYTSNGEEPRQVGTDPLVGKLLDREPREIALAEPMGMPFLLFLRLKRGSIQGVLDSAGRLCSSPTFLDRRSETLFVPEPRRPAVHVYGDAANAEWLMAEWRTWLLHNRRELVDYHVELVDRNATADGESAWLDRRPHATLRLSLRD